MILDRHIVCHLSAFSFCIFVLAPSIVVGHQVFWDRSLPFEYINTSFDVQAAFPGQQTQIQFITGPVKSYTRGEFDRVFYDACDNPMPLGTHPTEYDKTARKGKPGSFYKDFKIPERACPGEAVYTTRPRFWHNAIQGWLYPIEAPLQATKIRVLAKPEPMPPADIDDMVKQYR